MAVTTQNTTTYTSNYNLAKPGYEVQADIEDLNANADKIDAALTSQNQAIANEVTNRTTAVSNEASARAAADAILPCLVVNCGTISSLPATISNSNITADMVVLQQTLGTPSAQLSDWTWTTAAGSVTISGTISGSTTLVLYLMKSR